MGKKTISSAIGRNTYGGHSKLENQKVFLFTTQKQLFAKLKQEKFN